MIKDTIDVLVENNTKEADEFIKDIIIKKTGFNGNKDDDQEIISYLQNNNFELERGGESGQVFKIKHNGLVIAIFEIKTKIEPNGYNMKATMWLEEVNDEV